jgi:hypothetical protein
MVGMGNEQWRLVVALLGLGQFADGVEVSGLIGLTT